jgi:hypothetical protein
MPKISIRTCVNIYTLTNIIDSIAKETEQIYMYETILKAEKKTHIHKGKFKKNIVMLMLDLQIRRRKMHHKD